MTDEEWRALAPYAEAYANAKVAHDQAAAQHGRTVDEQFAVALLFARRALEMREAAHALDMARHTHLAQQTQNGSMSEVVGNA